MVDDNLQEYFKNLELLQDNGIKISNDYLALQYATVIHNLVSINIQSITFRLAFISWTKDNLDDRL